MRTVFPMIQNSASYKYTLKVCFERRVLSRVLYANEKVVGKNL